ncbi:MAG TPA: hypothetical protein VGO93_30310 [Candidatus Xenobia bacterium]
MPSRLAPRSSRPSDTFSPGVASSGLLEPGEVRALRAAVQPAWSPLALPHNLTSGMVYDRVNLPWFNFGMDFGDNTWGFPPIRQNAQVASTLDQLHGLGIEDVITWTIPDGRNLQFTPDGTPAGLTPGFNEDLSAYLDLLSARNMSGELVLIDGNTWFSPQQTFGPVLVGGHGDVITDPTGQKEAAFDTNFVVPMLDTIKAWQASHPGKPGPVSGISLGNELKYGVNKDPGHPDKNVTSEAQMQAFVQGRAALVHRLLPGVPVTTGAVTPQDMFDSWVDGKLSDNPAEQLDYYTFHHYGTESTGKLAQEFPWSKLSKKVYMGEFPGTPMPNGPGGVLDYMEGVAGPHGDQSRAAAPDRFLTGAAMWAGRKVDPWSGGDPPALLGNIQGWLAGEFR